MRSRHGTLRIESRGPWLFRSASDLSERPETALKVRHRR
jgi:hypothetical protein